jgi:hypothetical protein
VRARFGSGRHCERDKAAALKFLKRIMKKYGRPRSVVTDGLRAYSAAMKEIGVADRQEVARNLFPGGVRDAADLSALKAAGSADALIATALHEGRVVRADLEAI